MRSTRAVARLRLLVCAALAALLMLVAAGTLMAQPAGPPAHDHSTHAVATDNGRFLHDFFKVYVPRSICMNQEQDLIALHLISDVMIAAAYYSIPFALVYFVRKRRDVAFSWVFWLFAFFILACGTTHVMSVMAIWMPVYRVDGAIKLVTAALSVGTATALWPLIPRAILLPSPSQLEATVKMRTSELAEANSALRREMDAKAQLLESERQLRQQAERSRSEAERARLEAERATLQAEQANRMKDEFLATLSHELRTPLTAILGWTRLLERSHAKDAVVGPALEVIHRNAKAQARLIEDLLDMNRIVSGKLQLDLQPVRVADAITAALASIEPAARARRITLEHKQRDASADANEAARAEVVLGDPARLQQIIWNLLSNAVKFTPADGKVSVFCERIADDRSVRITVADTGEGIDADFLPHVFDRFRQADASISRRFGGLGLGLSIVRHLVELHGGRASVRSAGLGKGSEFSVELPAVAVPEAALQRLEAESGSAEVSVSLKGVRVLAVDDELDTQLLIRSLLESAGARVDVAGSANEAMDLLKAHRPDVVVSDIGMPGEDGYSFIRRVRQLELAQGRDTPAIALTAFARPEDRVNALRAGYQLHVPKPIVETELLLVIASLAKSRE